MSTIEWETVEPPRQEIRHKFIGGSSLGALMMNQKSKIQGIYDWIVNGVEGFAGNSYTERGHRYENTVRGLYVTQTGAILQPHPGLIHMEDWCAISLDDLAKSGVGVLCPVDYKTAVNSEKNMKKWGPNGTNVFPDGYRWQLVLYMAVLNRVLNIPCEHAELFTAFGEDVKDSFGNFTGEFKITETRINILPRNLQEEERALEVGRKFWREHIVPKIPPTQPKEVNVMGKLSAADMKLFDMFLTPAVAPAAPEVLTHDALGHVVQMPDATPLQGVTVTATGNTASVLPPDAPASHPELAAECPHCPPQKDGKPNQHLLAECPTLHPAPVEVKEKKPRKRKLEIKDESTKTTPIEAVLEFATTLVEAAHAPDPTPAKLLPDLPTTLQLFINCEPCSGQRPERLEPYVAMLAQKIAEACNAPDIRASDDKRLGFGKWKGALAAAARQNPPRGIFQISTADSDFASVVVEALSPLCAPGFPVRGTR